MRNILFVLSVLATMVVVGCSTPTTDNSVEEETVATTETTTTTTTEPVEDKSPFEYVLPQGVDYEDYTYIGDYVFSDMYDFANCVWFNGTANSEYGYFIVLEKIARVQYSGSGTPHQLYDWDNDTYPFMVKGTSYKVYLKPEYIQARKNAGQLLVFTSYGTTRDKNPDCNTFQVRANDYDYDVLTLSGEIDISDYVAY